jgi:hypothetical protein
MVQVASFCEWRLAQLQASGSINPTQSLKAAQGSQQVGCSHHIGTCCTLRDQRKAAPVHC